MFHTESHTGITVLAEAAQSLYHFKARTNESAGRILTIGRVYFEQRCCAFGKTASNTPFLLQKRS
jgi:hypothetical protein